MFHNRKHNHAGASKKVQQSKVGLYVTVRTQKAGSLTRAERYDTPFAREVNRTLMRGAIYGMMGSVFRGFRLF